MNNIQAISFRDSLIFSWEQTLEGAHNLYAIPYSGGVPNAQYGYLLEIINTFGRLQGFEYVEKLFVDDENQLDAQVIIYKYN